MVFVRDVQLPIARIVGRSVRIVRLALLRRRHPKQRPRLVVYLIVHVGVPPLHRPEHMVGKRPVCSAAHVALHHVVQFLVEDVVVVLRVLEVRPPRIAVQLAAVHLPVDAVEGPVAPANAVAPMVGAANNAVREVPVLGA